MATMYARSTLTTWDSVSGGWSNTSGGASNGTYPDSTTDVVFDANSGTSRTITTNTNSCLSINTTGANAMTFVTGTGDLKVYGDVNLTGSVSVEGLLLRTGPHNITAGGVIISNFFMDNAVATTVNLLSDFVTTSTFPKVSFTGSVLNVGAHNVTAGSVFATAGATLSLGSGVLTLTGSGTVWDGSGTIVAGTSTVKLTYSGSTGITFIGGGATFNNFWNATSGSSVVTLTGSNTFNNFRISAGRTQKFTAGTTTTVTSFTADGTGSPITIDSTTSSAFTLAKAGGGTNYSDYITLSYCTGSPASTWYARNSTNGGSNTNWTFIPGNSNFLQFC